MEEKQCKVCFCGNSNLNSEDELISVCKCKGSLKYIHISCLEKWIANKSKVEYKYLNQGVFKIILENFHCEICKVNFPLVVKKQKAKEYVYFISILKTKHDYVVFRSKLIVDENTITEIKEDINEHVSINNNNSTDNKKNIVEYIYVEFNKYRTKIKIGRDSKCDLQLNDVSVSRNHCEIYVLNNRLRVKDLNSTFGTLINNANSDIIINEDNKQAFLQKGNTVYFFKLQANNIN